MKDTIGVVGLILMIFACSSALHADPSHKGGLPPGLQKKYERGGNLPPGWRKKSPGYEYGYEEPYYDQYEPEYLEDKIIRIIKDVRNLNGSVSR